MNSLAQRLAWWSWLALLVAVPVTSFPLVEETIGGATVSPLSLIPLLPVVLIGLLPFYLRRRTVAAENLPLFAFVLLACLSTALALWYPIGIYKGVTPLERGVRGLSTLVIGLGFYLSAVHMPNSEHRIRRSLQAIYLGAFLSFAWASVQTWYVLDDLAGTPWRMTAIHRFFSVRDLITDRVVGLTYEPSWFGNQFVVLFLPLMLASILRGWSVFSFRVRWLTVEMLLALWGVPLLFLSRSRISVLSLAIVLAVVAFILAWRLSGWMLAAIQKRLPGRPEFSNLRAIVFVLGSLASIVLLGLAVQTWARQEPRLGSYALRTPFQLDAIREEFPYEVMFAASDRMAMAERTVYWSIGIAAYEQYPFFGIGLGNSGFLFEQALPDYGHRLSEIRYVLKPSSFEFPNPKSLWVRLLGETGMLGIAAFLTWLLVVGASALFLARRGQRWQQVVGLAGILFLVAQVTEGLSLDTFALPQLWIILGFAAGTAWRWRQASVRQATTQG